MDRMLDSGEAARRLGVKVTTLYAYVSRGLLESHPAPGGRRSLFDGDDVERLARRSRQGKAVETRMVTITTGISQLTDDGPLYRGRRATDLATQRRFEGDAELLWDAADCGRSDRDWPPVAVGDPPGLRPSDRMRWAAVIAERLAAKLSPAPTEAVVRGVNAALVLMADHELATSTIAVRVVASTRADPYDAVLAGMGTIAGPLHGGASKLAYSPLVDARRLGVERALDDTLRWQGLLPGFGHTVYADGDPRCTVLLGLLAGVASPEDADLLRSLLELAAEHAIPPPNVDLGLAAMAWATGMPPDAGQVLFTVARVAGWVAHYLEELDERPLRFRARAIYATSHRG